MSFSPIIFRTKLAIIRMLAFACSLSVSCAFVRIPSSSFSCNPHARIHRLSQPYRARQQRIPCSTAETSIVESDQEKHPIYWIDECEPNERTRALALKNKQNLALFLEKKPIAAFNKDAFDSARRAYENYCEQVGGAIPIILDSCCGTGR
jgi:hypothetical protein